MSKHELTRRATLGLMSAALMPNISWAAGDYPNKRVKMVVPYAAGGTSDVVARFVAQRMQHKLGQSVIVENRPGSGAIVGTQYVARADPDGYTLMNGGVSTHAINPNLRRKAPFDGIKDFTSIGMIGSGPLVVSVHPSLPVHNLQELIDYGKANPTKLACGSATGTILHLAAEVLKEIGGFEMLHVPYAGNGPALLDVLGGRVPVMIDNINNSAPHIIGGKLRAIVVPSEERAKLLPDVPISSEAGHPDFIVETWFALFGPAKMPDDVVITINKTMNAALQEPDTATEFVKLGVDVRTSSPSEAAAYLQAEFDRWRDVIKRIGLQTD
ncbi:tripartite tricarboxylate transporter substrate binding protein [Rhizobium sp. S152]|uniref:Bug family tripartite tricarboxylate transporter substrate binding protein n=1 Tax=Rhizobium sp. S152 TaxID=3055038 RepID=UPI0025A9AF90|nr:tripartite tricarboxylate transporter substrate binding protein [Rhizobium sp. S152]MDM9628016.1 tripartite tricarboxylate transporter substrate binding protein [Rhizobium sp. S152]